MILDLYQTKDQATVGVAFLNIDNDKLKIIQYKTEEAIKSMFEKLKELNKGEINETKRNSK